VEIANIALKIVVVVGLVTLAFANHLSAVAVIIIALRKWKFW
jgi:hypothetical protein